MKEERRDTMLKNKKTSYGIIATFLLGYFMVIGSLFSSFAVVNAEVNVTTDKDLVEKGDEIEVTIQLKNTKTAAFTLNLSFDDSKVEYVSGMENSNLVENRIIYVWYDTQGGKSAKQGELAKFKFKAKEEGTVNFTVAGEFYSQAGQLLQTQFKEAQVQIGKEETKLEKESIQEKGTNTQASNAMLKILRIDQEGVIPNFDKNINEYYLTVTNQTEEIEVLAIPENPNATLQITGNQKLKEGINKINIQIISEDKTQNNTYVIEVTKTANLESANTNLETLAIENALLNPPFDNTITHYQVEISNKIDNINMLAIPENEKATVEIQGKQGLKEGDNLVKVIVTAANKITKKEYEIKVKRRNQDEEKKYEKQQEENEEKLEEAYKIEKTAIEPRQENRQENNTITENSKTGIIIILVITILGIGAVSYYLYQKKNKKKD